MDFLFAHIFRFGCRPNLYNCLGWSLMMMDTDKSTGSNIYLWSNYGYTILSICGLAMVNLLSLIVHLWSIYCLALVYMYCPSMVYIFSIYGLSIYDLYCLSIVYPLSMKPNLWTCGLVVKPKAHCGTGGMSAPQKNVSHPGLSLIHI